MNIPPGCSKSIGQSIVFQGAAAFGIVIVRRAGFGRIQPMLDLLIEGIFSKRSPIGHDGLVPLALLRIPIGLPEFR